MSLPLSKPSAVLASPSVERVRSALSRAGLQADIVELPGAARTAPASPSVACRRWGTRT
jgi:hypothetical protein